MFKIKICIVYLLTVLQFSSCATVQQTTSESKTTNSSTPNSVSDHSPPNIDYEKFEKQRISNYETTVANLESNRRLWQESKIENYDLETYFQTVTGLPIYPVGAIKVRQGKLVSMQKKSDLGTGLSNYQKSATTVENMFDLIKQELDNKKIVNATYNEKLGYPERISIMWSLVPDNSVFLIIEKFKVAK